MRRAALLAALQLIALQQPAVARPLPKVDPRIATQEPPRDEPRRDEFQRGVCYAHAWRGAFGDAGYGSEASLATLRRLRTLGVNWISLTPFGYMGSTSSTAIRRFPGGETDERITVETQRAHTLGIRVALKPHLWLRGGAWQGALTFEDEAAFDAWLAEYRAFVLSYADLAEREKIDLLVVGTELKSATARGEAKWRALISDVRARYRGPLTYAANWDEAEHVPFWDALDFVGVQAYEPIASHAAPPAEELAAGWTRVADRLAALSSRTHKKILLTVLGYRADADAAMAPATWPEASAKPTFDPACQAACYRAAFDALWGRPWLAGIYVWKWFSDSRDEQGPTDFSPAGKPAEQVMGAFYRRPFAASQQKPPSRKR